LLTVTKKATSFEALRRKNGSDGLSRGKLTVHATYAARDVGNWAHLRACSEHDKSLTSSDALSPARSRQPGQKRTGATRANPVNAQPSKSSAGTSDSRNPLRIKQLIEHARKKPWRPLPAPGVCQRHKFCQVSAIWLHAGHARTGGRRPNTAMTQLRSRGGRQLMPTNYGTYEMRR
jgi:hypothetical protein